MVTYQPPQPMGNPDIVLTTLGRKIGTGSELTMAENLMAMTATSAATANRYGPGPAEMVVQRPELPETVKGVLASYIS